MDGTTILIVDDAEQNRLLLRDHVELLGHQPLLAENGAAALEIMAREPPDLVLLDILMPVLDGYGVLEHMRSDATLRDVPVVVISPLDKTDGVAR